MQDENRQKMTRFFFIIFFVLGQSSFAETSLRAYDQYLKQKKADARPNKAPAPEKPKEIKALKTSQISSLHKKYFELLFRNYEKQLQIGRFFGEYLRQAQQVSLTEVKIKSQKLQASFGGALEDLNLTSLHLERIQTQLKNSIRELQELCIASMETPLYSQFSNLKLELEFELNSYNFLLSEMVKLQSFHFGKMHQALQNVANVIDGRQAKLWHKSSAFQLLSEESEVVQALRQTNQAEAIGFRKIRESFVYMDAELLQRENKISQIRVPATRNAERAEIVTGEKRLALLQKNLSLFLESQLVELRILQGRIEQGATALSRPLRLTALAPHLFLNHTMNSKKEPDMDPDVSSQKTDPFHNSQSLPEPDLRVTNPESINSSEPEAISSDKDPEFPEWI